VLRALGAKVMHRIKWKESRNYVEATRSDRTYPLPGYLILWVFFAVLMSPIYFVSKYSVLITFLMLVVGSAVITVCVASTSMFCANTVLLAEHGIVLGRQVHKYEEIDSATVGALNIVSCSYPVLSFITDKNVQHTYGLGDNVDPQVLWDFLDSKGVRLI
jgi:hypothetical protein